MHGNLFSLSVQSAWSPSEDFLSQDIALMRSISYILSNLRYIISCQSSSGLSVLVRVNRNIQRWYKRVLWFSIHRSSFLQFIICLPADRNVCQLSFSVLELLERCTSRFGTFFISSWSICDANFLFNLTFLSVFCSNALYVS